MFVLVFLDIEEITAVPLLPQPIMPTRIAEFALEPKTIPGLRIVKAESVAVALKKDLLFIIIVYLQWKGCALAMHYNIRIIVLIDKKLRAEFIGIDEDRILTRE